MLSPFRYLENKIPDPAVRNNFLYHLIDGSFFIFAMSFVSVHTIIPVYLKELGASSVIIGLFPALWSMGLNFPQLFITKHKPGTAIRPVLLVNAFAHRFSFLIIGLFSLFFAGRNNFTLVSVLVLTFLTALSGARAIPSWVDMFSKTVPRNLRGRLIAYRQLAGSVLGAGAGYILGKVLAAFPFPQNFGILFILCFLLTLVSFYCLAQVKEETNSAERIDEGTQVRTALQIFRQDKNFRNFVLSDILYGMGFTANAFYAVYAIGKFGLTASASGMFTIITMGSMTVSNPLFGLLGDKKGHRLNLILFGVFSAAASLTTVVAPNQFVYGLVFVLMASAMNLQGISRVYFTVELCTPAERQKYISLLNTITSPVIFFGILSGWLISMYGYQTGFIISAVLMLCGSAVLYFTVSEPRHLPGENT